MPLRHRANSRAGNDTHEYAALTLPQSIQSSVPSCAQPCLSSYIQQEYTCSPDDISCLCEVYSSQGFTLGELAYGCLRQDCSGEPDETRLEVYNICSAQAAAVQPTHRTLTLPSTPTTVPAIATTTVEVTATPAIAPSHRPLQPSRTTPTSFTATPSVSPVATGTSGSAEPAMAGSVTTTSASYSETAAAAARSSTDLTSAQAVGISVGAFGALGLAVAAIFLIGCLRRRRVAQHKPERHSYDFVDDAPPRFSPFNYGVADPRGPLGGFANPRAELANERTRARRSEWHAPIREKPQSHEMSAEPSLQDGRRRSISPQSHRSNDSMRTLSQLLPDRPGQTPPMPPKKSPRPASIFTAATVFEEDRTPKIGSPQPMTLPMPPHPARTTSRRSKQPQYTNQYTRSPDDVRQPSLSIEIPRRASSNDRVATPVDFPPPPVPKDRPVFQPLRVSTGSKTKSTHSSQPPNSATSHLLDYYTSNASGTPTEKSPNSPTPIDESEQKRRPAPATIKVTKPTYPPRAVRSSGASDTSFESSDPNEPTPPDELDRQLTPVKETPSPISGIRYPKVPRSSNQSVPRSPKPSLSPRQIVRADEPWHPSRPPAARIERANESHRAGDVRRPMTPERRKSSSGSLNGSTLVAKRRGDSAAKDLEQKLYIKDSSHSRGNSRAASLHSPKSEGQVSADSLKRRDRTSKQQSPLQGYGRVRSGGRRPKSSPYAASYPQKLSYDDRQPSYAGNGYGQTSPEMRSPLPSSRLMHSSQGVAMKSPLWEPKLTPSRRGDDLFLSVSLATPCATPFSPPLSTAGMKTPGTAGSSTAAYMARYGRSPPPTAGLPSAGLPSAGWSGWRPPATTNGLRTPGRAGYMYEKEPPPTAGLATPGYWKMPRSH